MQPLAYLVGLIGLLNLSVVYASDYWAVTDLTSRHANDSGGGALSATDVIYASFLQVKDADVCTSNCTFSGNSYGFEEWVFCREMACLSERNQMESSFFRFRLGQTSSNFQLESLEVKAQFDNGGDGMIVSVSTATHDICLESQGEECSNLSCHPDNNSTVCQLHDNAFPGFNPTEVPMNHTVNMEHTETHSLIWSYSLKVTPQLITNHAPCQSIVELQMIGDGNCTASWACNGPFPSGIWYNCNPGPGNRAEYRFTLESIDSSAHGFGKFILKLATTRSLSLDGGQVSYGIVLEKTFTLGDDLIERCRPNSVTDCVLQTMRPFYVAVQGIWMGETWLGH